MTFCAIDDKGECFGYYSDGQLYFNGKKPSKIDKTWRYLPFLSKDIEFAHLYCGGKSLDSQCPASLMEDWSKLSNRLKAYLKSFHLAKVDLNQVCFYDLVPEQFLLEFFEAKCQIIDNAISLNKRPPNYEYMLNLEEMIQDIKTRKLEINFDEIKLDLANSKVRDFKKKFDSSSKTIQYNQFGTKTGRLGVEGNSFQILTVPKKFRGYLKPKNGWFLELDYNAAEIRTLIALSGREQPLEDIHQWNMNKVGSTSRDEVKQMFFAWLYGSSKVDGAVFEKLYETEQIKNKYWDGKKVINHYGREIESDEYHSINYIVQSTAAEISLRQAIKVFNFLKGKKSFISMIIHDSIIVDLDLRDKEYVEKIVDLFSITDFGKFKTSVSVGKSLNNMRKIDL